MKQRNTLIISALALMLPACDGIFSLDNFEPPDQQLTGRVVFNGEPVGVRVPNNTPQIDLWQIEPEYELEESIPLYLNMDGEFTTLLFSGTYEATLREGSGPWVEDPTRHSIVVSGPTTFDIPVQPFYTIEEEAVSYSAGPGPGGSITATFRVGQHDTSRDLEYVGVYVNKTTFVDRQRSEVREELSKDDIQTQLDSNGTITITVNLPDDIHVTPGPERRNKVHLRVGVKSVGVPEMLFTQVYEVAI